MKRKLVTYERFEQMKENALSAVAHELVEAQDHLARMLGSSFLTLESFDERTVIYETDGGNFVKANYSVEGDAVTFDDIEELVIDEASENTKRREVAAGILEAILDDKDSDAHSLFEKYMDFASTKHRRSGSVSGEFSEAEQKERNYFTRKAPGGQRYKHVKGSGHKDMKRSRAAKASWSSGRRKTSQGIAKRKSHLPQERSRRARFGALAGSRAKKHVNEWLNLCHNVFEYADIVENGYVLKESVVRTDAQGQLQSVRIPTAKARNEGKIIKMHFANLIKQDSPKVMREAALRLSQDLNFGKAVAELKRHNNMADNSGLEESLGTLVSGFPAVLYLTPKELSHTIGTALESSGVTNFTDETCTFMADAVLRVAHDAYSDRVSKMVKLSGVTNQDTVSYESFRNVMAGYFASLDESIESEMKVFEDLYSAVLDVRKFALESQNEEVRDEANDIIGELEAILGGRVHGNLDLAVEVADWINGVAEANLPGADKTWDVVKTAHHTVTGDHPQMAKNAKVDGIPGKYPGDWPDPAPMIGQEKMAYTKANADEARHRSWSNKGGKDVWPSLDNPNIPKPFGDYTMKGEKGADKDGESDWSRYSSGETWPGLQNPYVPKSNPSIFKQKIDPSGKLD